MLRKRWFIGLAATAASVGAYVALCQGPVSAATGTIHIDADPNYGGVDGGGEFDVVTFTGMTPPTCPVANPSDGSVFQTFCLELNEGINYYETDDWDLSDSAKLGGVTGGVNGADPISPETAYLYSHFWDGDLQGYNYTPGATTRAASANQLQRAIWFLEGEIPSLDTTADAQALAFIQLADDEIAAGNWPANGIGDVRVLNLTNSLLGPRQDVLIKIASDHPSLTLVKTASPNPCKPGETVTYSYVVTNTGGVALSGLTIVDDHGTPGDTSDDVTVATGVSLAVNESKTFTWSTILPIKECMNIGGVDTFVGTLYVVPQGNGDVCLKYVQSRNVNDNVYGTPANGLDGWSKHNFSDLTGSDKCEFIIFDKNGTKVFDGFEDYITSSSAFPSGYGTLGVTGGDGSMVTGSAANAYGFQTSISNDLNQGSAFYGYTSNSPTPEASFPTWDYVNWYQICVKAAQFPNGFGSAAVGIIHNSPSKLGFNAYTPTPCDNQIKNIATATATVTGSSPSITVTATDDETVDIQAPAAPPVSLTVGTPTFSSKNMSIAFKNTGTTTCTLSALNFAWPSGATDNKGLVSIKIGAVTLFNTLSPGPSVSITSWLGKLSDRQIGAGKTKTLKFTFQQNAKTNVSLYHLSIDFGGGLQTILP